MQTGTKTVLLCPMALLLFFALPCWAQTPPPPAVTVIHVAEEEVNPPAEYVGRVEAVQAVDLRARVEGFLDEVRFREGAEVREGDVLYVIEQAPYRARVAEARGRAARADAALTSARQYLDRLRTVRPGGVPATDIDTALGVKLQAEAELQEAMAALDRAELDLGYTVVTAPIRGRIGRTAFTRGNLVGPDSGPLARIVQMDPIRVVYSVSESDIAGPERIRTPGREDCRLVPRLRLPCGEIYGEAGSLDFVDNEVDPDTGTVAVRAAFANPEGLLIPGQYVTVLVSCGEGPRLPVVPQSAVQEDRLGRSVFVVDAEGTVEQRRITTGAAIGTAWAVESGLAPGETVIVQGIQKVTPGQTVRPVAQAGNGRD